jgi:hypothetical protein
LEQQDSVCWIGFEATSEVQTSSQHTKFQVVQFCDTSLEKSGKRSSVQNHVWSFMPRRRLVSIGYMIWKTYDIPVKKKTGNGWFFTSMLVYPRVFIGIDPQPNHNHFWSSWGFVYVPQNLLTTDAKRHTKTIHSTKKKLRLSCESHECYPFLVVNQTILRLPQ